MIVTLAALASKSLRVLLVVLCALMPPSPAATPFQETLPLLTAAHEFEGSPSLAKSAATVAGAADGHASRTRV